ncbi:MAG TPA: hypothetical protein VFV19_17460 [Candidatus Polarisedimenticolaceae bacterium]|nr:hypothetical protein [Candidatus Polarisedimenticolaceae bacterium]
MITLALVVAFLAAVLYGAHRLLERSEGRGERHRGGSGALGTAFLEIQAMVEPSKRVVLEERRKEPSEGLENGDPPEPAARR